MPKASALGWVIRVSTVRSGLPEGDDRALSTRAVNGRCATPVGVPSAEYVECAVSHGASA